MNADQKAALSLLIDRPAQFGKMMGYTLLRDGLHGRWIRAIVRDGPDMTLQAHRGSYKTTCLGVAMAILMMLHGDKNLIFLRKTDADVVEVINSVRRILTHPATRAIYFALFGESLTLLQDKAAEITTSAYSAARGSAQLLGIGLGGSLTGKHADIIITDDIVNRADRVSPAERARTCAVYQELQNIRNLGGRIVNTGTPWHKEDAFTLMPAPMVFDCYTTKLLSDEKIAQLRQSMEPSLFAANYELRHIASGNALFETAPPFVRDTAFLRDGIAHIDAAYGGEDFTALTCAARRGDRIYLYGRLWRAHVDTVLDAALADCARYLCAPVYCETNADKGYLAREIRARGAQARPYPEKMNKYSKISTYLRKWWPAVCVMEGTDPEYVAQILDYTETARHDDAPDSAACVCRILDRKE